MSLRVGIEFEWLAPKGLSRQTYAQYLATQIGGSVQSFWHPQVEPAKVPGTPLFHNLTQGFAILDADGSKLAHTVGDLTIQAQLTEHSLPNRAGTELSVMISDCCFSLRHTPVWVICILLFRLRNIWNNTTTTRLHHRIEDEYQLRLFCAPMPGERECEVVSEYRTTFTSRKTHRTAQKLGFTVPIESATHIHFCARPFSIHEPLETLSLLHTYRWVLRDILKPTSAAFVWARGPRSSLFVGTRFCAPILEQARHGSSASADQIRDFNIKNLIHDFQAKIL